MSRSLRTIIVLAAVSLIAATADAPDPVGRTAVPAVAAAPRAVAELQYDPQFILEAVANRMGVTLRPDVPPPVIRLESRTPLERLQAAAERQWGFRPEVFTTMYATATNEVYLIDEARLYKRYGYTLDDSLAHELVHYIQARYLGDRFTIEWSEAEAVAIQRWFRRQFLTPRLVAVKPPRVTLAP
jgi:hypothetical protein